MNLILAVIIQAFIKSQKITLQEEVKKLEEGDESLIEESESDGSGSEGEAEEGESSPGKGAAGIDDENNSQSSSYKVQVGESMKVDSGIKKSAFGPSKYRSGGEGMIEGIPENLEEEEEESSFQENESKDVKSNSESSIDEDSSSSEEDDES